MSETLWKRDKMQLPSVKALLAEYKEVDVFEIPTEDGIEHEVELMPMKPAHALVEAAEQHGARMIVVGSHGEAPLKGAILGSTPYKLLHQTEVPVLVVPARR